MDPAFYGFRAINKWDRPGQGREDARARGCFHPRTLLFSLESTHITAAHLRQAVELFAFRQWAKKGKNSGIFGNISYMNIQTAKIRKFIKQTDQSGNINEQIYEKVFV